MTERELIRSFQRWIVTITHSWTGYSSLRDSLHLYSIQHPREWSIKNTAMKGIGRVSFSSGEKTREREKFSFPFGIENFCPLAVLKSKTSSNLAMTWWNSFQHVRCTCKVHVVSHQWSRWIFFQTDEQKIRRLPSTKSHGWTQAFMQTDAANTSN